MAKGIAAYGLFGLLALPLALLAITVMAVTFPVALAISMATE